VTDRPREYALFGQEVKAEHGVQPVKQVAEFAHLAVRQMPLRAPKNEPLPVPRRWKGQRSGAANFAAGQCDSRTGRVICCSKARVTRP
jgi:hypothetical protein